MGVVDSSVNMSGELAASALAPGLMVPPPQAPVGLGGSSVEQAPVWQAYYHVYGLWLERGRILESLPAHGRPSGGSDMDGGAMSQLCSEISVSSSASSGKAARRARWRKNKAARARRSGCESELSYGLPGGVTAAVCDGDSQLTYSLVVPGESVCGESEDGYCYLAMTVPYHRETVKEALGSYPTFEKLLFAPGEWFGEMDGFSVSRVKPGEYHLSTTGMVGFVDCAESVMQRAGVDPRPGTLGAAVRLCRRAVAPILVAKAPKLRDVCGGSSSCDPCAVARLYSQGGGSWAACFTEVDFTRRGLRREVRCEGGTVLRVYDLGHGWAVFPFSCQEDLAYGVQSAAFACVVHGTPIAECGCLVNETDPHRVFAHIVSRESVPRAGCSGKCGERVQSRDEHERVMEDKRAAMDKPQRWRCSEPDALRGLEVYRQLGGFL